MHRPVPVTKAVAIASAAREAQIGVVTGPSVLPEVAVKTVRSQPRKLQPMPTGAGQLPPRTGVDGVGPVGLPPVRPDTARPEVDAHGVELKAPLAPILPPAQDVRRAPQQRLLTLTPDRERPGALVALNTLKVRCDLCLRALDDCLGLKREYRVRMPDVPLWHASWLL